MAFDSREELDVDITHLDASGDGVARAGRRTFTVPFTIPGEHVRVRVRDRQQPSSAPAAALLVEVLRASPHRITPRCPHFGPRAEPGVGPCGGCAWQHIAYPEQLRLKALLVEQLLEQSLRRVPPVRPTLPGTSPDNPWGYRHKVHFVFGNVPAPGRRRSTLVMGHYVRGSRRIIPVRECPVHDERGNRAAFGFYDAFGRGGVTAADSGDTTRQAAVPTGAIRSVALRVAAHGPEMMATLVVSNDRDKRVRAATRRAMEHSGAPTALHLNVHPRGDASIFGRDTRRISGPDRLREQVAGTAFLISPTAFFQTNIYAAERLVELVLDAVPAGATVLDLYAGAGLFALPLARRGHAVTAVEENRAAIADGEASARLNRVPPDRLRFIARRVETALGSIRDADVVVLDPPRDGCSPSVIDEVFGQLRPRRVIYVSCNPEALARDLAAAAPHRYTIDSIQPVDMFPHTAHVETVVVMTTGRLR